MDRFWFTTVIFLLSMLQVACNTNLMLGSASHLTWLEEEESETQSIMHTLAISISRMEDATVRELTPDERRLAVDAQLEIIEELSELLAEQSVEDLTGAETGNSHIVINENIGAFLTHIRQARNQVQKDPANYFIAGKVAGYCQICHEHRE